MKQHPRFGEGDLQGTSEGNGAVCLTEDKTGRRGRERKTYRHA